MAKMKTGADEFSQTVYASILQSAANALEFTQLQTGYGSLERIGWVIEKIEYYLTALSGQIATQLLLASDDVIQCAIVTSNGLSALSLQRASVIDMMELRIDIRSAVGFELYMQPFVRDFTQIQGGGILCLPYPLFLAIDSASIASAVQAEARIRFKQVELSDSQWVELVEATRLLT